MTCIAAFKERNKVYIAGDRAITAGFEQTILSTPKIFVKKFKSGKKILDIGIGCAGNLRVLNLLYCCFEPPEKTVKDALSYVVSGVVPEIVKCLLSVMGQGEKEMFLPDNSQILVALEGRIFIIWHDLGVEEPADNYCAIGSGDSYARGYMCCAEDEGHYEAIDIVEGAVKCACRFVSNCNGPIDVIEVK